MEENSVSGSLAPEVRTKHRAKRRMEKNEERKGRLCQRCDARMSVYNDDSICFSCQRNIVDLKERIRDIVDDARTRADNEAGAYGAQFTIKAIYGEAIYDSLRLMADPRTSLWRGGASDIKVLTGFSEGYVYGFLRNFVKAGLIERVEEPENNGRKALWKIKG